MSDGELLDLHGGGDGLCLRWVINFICPVCRCCGQIHAFGFLPLFPLPLRLCLQPFLGSE